MHRYNRTESVVKSRVTDVGSSTVEDRAQDRVDVTKHTQHIHTHSDTLSSLIMPLIINLFES